MLVVPIKRREIYESGLSIPQLYILLQYVLLTAKDALAESSNILCPIIMRSSVNSGRFDMSSAVILPSARFVLMNSLMMKRVHWLVIKR